MIDRRLAPRPLPAHLASTMMLWLSSRAGLTTSPAGWKQSSWHGGAAAAASRLASLAEEVARLGTEPVAASLDRLILARAAAFLDGIEAYRAHPYRRADPGAPVLWSGGAARLLDYGGGSAGAVLIVPSLINRYYIVDLQRERSFARHLAARGLRPLVLDWGAPGTAERGFALDDYIAGPLDAALDAAVAAAGGSVAVLGYCMGGLLALATALRRPADVAALALLATPWDFHAEPGVQGQVLASLIEGMPFDGGDSVPVSLIQSLFLALDPFLAERKFVGFSRLDPQSDAATSFVALEDWINDGVPLARGVALDCARFWYHDNTPAKGLWQVAARPVRPRELAMPALVVLPGRDRIVPPASAEPLAVAIPDAAVLRPAFGHIGMMASEKAPAAVWPPIAEWLRAQLD